MPKFFVEKTENQIAYIIGTDVNHLKKVLRKQVGDRITICDKSTKKNYLAEIKELNENDISCFLLEELAGEEKTEPKITIFQGLPKAEKMEWIIQKSVELGACKIVPIQMKRCVAKLEEKNQSKKIERWQKIAEAAAKQCGTDTIPVVDNLISVSLLAEKIKEYDRVLIAYEEEKDNSIKTKIEEMKIENINNIGIVIGPEGGLEQKEVELLTVAGAESVTLGKRILRTETVALTVLSILMYELGNLN